MKFDPHSELSVTEQYHAYVAGREAIGLPVATRDEWIATSIHPVEPPKARRPLINVNFNGERPAWHVMFLRLLLPGLSAYFAWSLYQMLTGSFPAHLYMGTSTDFGWGWALPFLGFAATSSMALASWVNKHDDGEYMQHLWVAFWVGLILVGGIPSAFIGDFAADHHRHSGPIPSHIESAFEGSTCFFEEVYMDDEYKNPGVEGRVKFFDERDTGYFSLPIYLTDQPEIRVRPDREYNQRDLAIEDFYYIKTADLGDLTAEELVAEYCD